MASRKLIFCQYNIGHLSGPVYRKKKSYAHEITNLTLTEFFPYLIRKILPQNQTDVSKKNENSAPNNAGHKNYFPDKKSAVKRAELLCDFVNSQNFDILTLNEIDRMWPFDTVDLLVKKTKLTQAEFASCYAIPFIMDNGNAVLSKHKIQYKKEYYLDTKEVFINKYFNGGRRAVEVKADLGDIQESILCTHLIPITGKRKKHQVAKLAEFIATILENQKKENKNESIILCADLNSTLKFKPKYYWGDDDKYTGSTLQTIEKLVNKKNLPDWFLKMFEKNEDFIYGTYPVNVTRKGLKRVGFPADRFLDYILPIGKDSPRITKLNVEAGIFISDHYPLTAEVECTGQK